jgi:hypothetical protein
MCHDSEVSAEAGTQQVCGEATGVVRVALVDVHGHPYEFTLAVEDADELAAHLRLAVEAVA